MQTMQPETATVISGLQLQGVPRGKQVQGLNIVAGVGRIGLCLYVRTRQHEEKAGSKGENSKRLCHHFTHIRQHRHAQMAGPVPSNLANLVPPRSHRIIGLDLAVNTTMTASAPSAI